MIIHFHRVFVNGQVSAQKRTNNNKKIQSITDLHALKYYNSKQSITFTS